MHCGSKQKRGIGIGGAIVLGLFIVFVFNLVAPSTDTRAPKLTPEQKAQKAKDDALRAEKSSATKLCMQAVRAAAKFPSSVDFSLLNSPSDIPLQGGGWKIRLAFESKNGFGNLIPQTAICEVRDGKMLNFYVVNR